LDAELKWKDITDFKIKARHKISSKILMKKLEFRDEVFPRLVAGYVKSVASHAQADKLYVMKVDVGSEVRQIVAGLKPYYKPGQLRDKRVVIVSNLEPVQLRGVESQGMLLACENATLIETKAEPGTVAEGFECSKQINYKKFSTFDLRIEKGKLVLDGEPVMFGKHPASPEKNVRDGERVM